jgi:tetratricopeptide (TPR) repeat protein
MPEILRSACLFGVFLTLTTLSSSQTVLSYTPATTMADTTGSDVLLNRSPVTVPFVSNEELGELFMYRQRYQAAIETFKEIESPSARVWNQIGIAYQMMYDYKDAIRSYKEALRLNAHDSIVLGNLATALDGISDFTAAEKNYRKSLKLNPNSALTLKNLGTNLLMQHKYEAGAAAYKQALAIDARIFENQSGFKMSDPAPRSERGTAAYFKAKSCALAGLNDCAITFLREALNERIPAKQLVEEEDLAALRKTAAYTNLIAAEQ